MSTTKNTDGSISIVAMSLVEFLPEVVKASKEGYELDVESNAGYPQNIGHLITVTMFKSEPVPKNLAKAVHTEDTPPVVAETDELPVKVDGRKKKV
jgi:CRISPR/Cas system-associated exonuclease Cas4 (RecB family)